MQRTQISSWNQSNTAASARKRVGVESVLPLIRTLIDEHLGRSQPPEEDPFDRLVGIGEGTGEPVGREHDRYLYGSGAP
ncbi:MAG: hypothetical protein ACFCVA_05625 [Gammaproteobacteria bacterium]